MNNAQHTQSYPYKSCYFVEKSLIFHPDMLYHCCIPVNGKFGSTDICHYYGGSLPTSIIDCSRNKYRKMFQSCENNTNEHCYGCSYLQTHEWNSAYFLENIHFNHSLLCNLNCNFCCQRRGNYETQRARYSILPIVHEVIDNNHLSPDGYIFWAGGEPMMIPEFEESLQLMIEYGVINEIATNSTIFSDVIYNGLKNGNVKLKTSIDCGTQETFQNIKSSNLFDVMVHNLSKYAATGADVGAKYIVSHDNIATKDLDGFIDILKNNNIHYVYIDINHNFPPSEITDTHTILSA